MMNKSIKSKVLYGLILLIIFPLLGLLHLSLEKFYLNFNSYRDLERFIHNLDLSSGILHLIEELQKERGKSHILLGSLKEKDKKELEIQYQNTENLIKKLQFKFDIFQKFPKLTELENIRKRVLSLSIKQDAVYSFYTDLIEDIISYEYETVKSINDLVIYNRFYCLILIQELKEKMGQERAIIAFSISKGTTTETVLEELKEIKYTRNLIEKKFLLLASENVKDSYLKLKKDLDLSSEIERIIKNPKHELSVEEWWNIATDRIKKMEQIHDMVESEILDRMKTLTKKSRDALIVSTIQLFLAIFLTPVVVLKFKKFIEKHIFFDPLTNLPNRKFFIEYSRFLIERAERYSEPLSLLLLDIDNFKQINDTFGHSFGDRILFELADTIRKNIRKSDFPARIGGEEFVVIFPNTDLKSAFIVSERIRQSFESLNIRKDEKSVKTTLSGGLIGYRKNMTIDDLLKLSDLALYNAKNRGKNRIEKYEEN